MPAVIELTEANKSYHFGRVSALQPDARPRWGRMSAVEMVAHLRRAIQVSLGEVPVRDNSTFWTRTVSRWHTMNSIEWAKGKIEAPAEFLPEAVDGFEEEAKRLKEAIERFTAAHKHAPTISYVHPVFGPMNLASFAKFHGKHMDHHFTQFGV